MGIWFRDKSFEAKAPVFIVRWRYYRLGCWFSASMFWQVSSRLFCCRWMPDSIEARNVPMMLMGSGRATLLRISIIDSNSNCVLPIWPFLYFNTRNSAFPAVFMTFIVHRVERRMCWYVLMLSDVHALKIDIPIWSLEADSIQWGLWEWTTLSDNPGLWN